MQDVGGTQEDDRDRDCWGKKANGGRSIIG